ncbi:hypothetical protein [Vulcanisaeta souniana]|uniref:Uncharacterized protein n=1 Tax=Vulcanisaeta souniana JCM 11219 TaxID=1293586 RepID=A0A830EII5_9CREN|nr:hypothetical protein [Vulcanisaeta souniana]BDR92250.1 hypothetical protein Vsou_13430 [Vulcanisaeta souniana JCM 11219]GGI86185.1 hypothetical protein GCM10007112_24000 [Vulcanisaeta souniana JCM 11219]
MYRVLLREFIRYVLEHRNDYLANVRNASVVKITTRDFTRFLGMRGYRVSAYSVSGMMGRIEEVLEEFKRAGRITGYECGKSRMKRCLIYL